MKTFITLCFAALVLSGCVISPLYGGDGREHAGSHEGRDRDQSHDNGNRDRDGNDRHGDSYRN